ncbi:hypothetical protein [Leeuwenhoekiella parthenopeia]|uniref:Uncharacterized protein n=1 Tax=Leeuwenhoekiella parthenopeia TaxID=2890320 RepID=A0ABS8GRU5_9FLAO|nr:hypothetical protein [Leeuwenhoekiella parthenopeia]MCC4212706.1 hypothetical protein [Leeuwenhoekiella parthenopeia]
MAKPVSKLGAFTGTIDGITYYKLNGKLICRKAAAPTKAQINNDPRFAAVKQNNNEFGGASTYAKAIRSGLEEQLNQFKDLKFYGRLTGACQKIAKAGRGVPGQRSIHALNLPEALIGLQLNLKNNWSTSVGLKPEIKPTSNGIEIQFNGFKKQQLYGVPKNTTHLILLATCVSIPEYSWDNELKKYTPSEFSLNPTTTSLNTAPLALNSIPSELEFFLPFCNPQAKSKPQSKTSVSASSEKPAHTIWMGILFGQLLHADFVPVEAGKAMQCIAVC